MGQRVGIARALALNPAVLVCDEVTSALDVSIQKHIIELLVDIQRKKDLSIIFVCHDPALVQSVSHQMMVMYLGGTVETPPGSRVQKDACHPYSKALLSSIFSVDMDFTKPIVPQEGKAPSPLDMPAGCAFHTRCSYCFGRCREQRPALHTAGDEHAVACHLFDAAVGKEEAC